MEGTTFTAEEAAEFKKLKAEKAKQKRYQNMLTAKNNLRVKWAKLKGCPIDQKHAEFYVDLDKGIRDTLSVTQILEFAESKEEKDEATAHAIAMLKKEGTEAPEEQEPGAQVV